VTVTVPLAELSPSSCRWLRETADGEWLLERSEDDRTTWLVAHMPERVIVADYMASLTECRAYVASGEAQADLERILAHERGEHEAERSTSCVKC
jgi:hypothetical protein